MGCFRDCRAAVKPRRPTRFLVEARQRPYRWVWLTGTRFSHAGVWTPSNWRV